jgi:lipopolysaccharide/colanic/teichoic acid biosynthesis glycosyltransferase
MQVEDAHPAARNSSAAPAPGSERLRAVTSRALDLLIAGALLVLSAPLLLLAALAIRLESRGPAFYRQRRVGRRGEPFELWKLRTMVPGAEEMGAGIYVLEGDPRITRVGRLLRRLSLDELPNLINVLKGEMALVGPRPTIQEQVDRYTDRQRRRLEVKPGITGWAQVNGRLSLPWPERIELDVWYVEHRSVWLDLRILARTVGMLVTGRGLYSEDLRQGWDQS